MAFIMDLHQESAILLYLLSLPQNDEPLIILEGLEPGLDISCAVAKAAVRLKPCVIEEERCAQLRDQFFLGIRF